MHPALHSWRDELPAAFVRVLAYLGGLAVLSVLCAQFFQSPTTIGVATPAQQTEWIEIERPFPAFALSIPEAADVPSSYAIRRNVEGGGRKDILMLGEPDSVSPYLQVEIYRPGREIRRFAGAEGHDRRERGRARAGRPAPLTSRWRANSVRWRSSPSRRRKACPATASLSCAPMTIRAATVRLVLPGRRRFHRALDARLRARPADAALRRQRTEGRRLVRASRTQSQLSAASTTRFWRRRPSTRCYGRRWRPARSRAASAAERSQFAPSSVSSHYHSLRLFSLQRENNFARRLPFSFDRPIISSDHIQIKISKAAAMAGSAE